MNKLRKPKQRTTNQELRKVEKTKNQKPTPDPCTHEGRTATKRENNIENP
jgi:hypothetical protein